MDVVALFIKRGESLFRGRNTLNKNKEKSSGGDEDLASDEGAAKGTSMITLSRETILANGGTR
jgi:hypothetical protein